MKDIKEKLMYILGAVIVIGIFGLIAVLMYVSAPESNKDLLNIAIGALIGSFITVVNYFYGSSKGSAEKTEMLNNSVPIEKKD